MRSILSFAFVIGAIAFMHASNVKLPDEPTTFGNTEEAAIPGAPDKLPVPDASEALVYMPDSLFQNYRGNHNLFVTNHYHVLYVKTDSVFLTSPSPVTATRQRATMNFLFR